MSGNGFTNSRATSPFDDDSRMGGRSPVVEAEATPAHRLDSQKNQALFQKLQEWYDQEWQRQAANRFQQALDCDYYDGLQWSEEDAQVLMERNQAPLVFNEIKPTIDWIIGTERRTRIDFKILGREKSDNDSANAKTQLLKYLDDTNKAAFHRSHAFADAVRSGVGWIELGLRGDPTEELLFQRHESWRNMLYDSNDQTRDLSEARYVFRWKHLDADIAETYFPDRLDVIRGAVNDGVSIASESDDELFYLGQRVTSPSQDYAGASVGRFTPIDHAALAWSRRSRVKMIECWYRQPVMKRKFSSGLYRGAEFDSNNPEHAAMLRQGASVFDKLEMEIRCAIFTTSGLVWEGPSPYRHGRFPFVPIWCYRRQRDNAPYGAIRQIRDPQDDLNKRHSKAQWILSTNQVEMEEGAVDDIEELRAEVARPDAIIVKNRGRELKISRDNQLAEEQLMLMDRDANHIRNVGGVTDENLGRQTNADSGKAIVARQEQGGVVTAEIFDNLRYAVQLSGEIALAMVEQFYTMPKVVRVLGERGAAKYHDINKIDPLTGEVLNDITANAADYVVSEQDFKSSLRQAMFESLFDIVGRLAQMNPEVALNLLDLVVELADLPNRDELVSRIRKINGQRDPDVEPTPEEQAAQQEAEEKKAEQEQLQVDTLRAELEDLRASTKDKLAAAVKKGTETAYAAMQAGQVIATMPAVAPIADEVMKGAGYQDPNPAGTDPNFPVPPAAMAPQVDFPGNTSPMLPATAGTGEMAGIETKRADGVINPPGGNPHA
jgi:hypothetical protein